MEDEWDRLSRLRDERQIKLLDDMEAIALRQIRIMELLEKIASNMGIVIPNPPVAAGNDFDL